MSTNKFLYGELSYKVIGLAMEVHKKLGCGFLEKVYENSMMVAFRREAIAAKQQSPVKVYFDGQEVGYYVADIIVEDKIILELKTASNLIDEHKAQALNYLKATNLRLAILLNFGTKSLQYDRLIN